MKRLLSPGLLWPLFIVALLLMSVGMSVRALIASHSDGGVQPVPDYYATAARFDEQTRARAASDALGWHLAVTPGGLEASGLRAITFAVTDSAGRPLPHLMGTIRLSRPDRVDTLATVPFHASGDAYGALMPMTQPGLWDVTIQAHREAQHFSRTVRVEVF